MIYTINLIIQQTFIQYLNQKNYTSAQLLIQEYIKKINDELENKIIQEKKINNFSLTYKHNDTNINVMNNAFEKKLQLSKLTVSWKDSKNHIQEISVWI